MFSKSEARDKCDEFGIDYDSKTPVAELRGLVEKKEVKIAKDLELAQATQAAEEIKEAGEETEEAIAETIETDTQKVPVQTIEGNIVKSIDEVDGYYMVTTVTGLGYKLPPHEFKSMIKTQKKG